MNLDKNAKDLAVSYFIQRAYIILHRNYRFSRFEIDIIATKDETLHFIEVKSLSNDAVTNPEVNVPSKKF